MIYTICISLMSKMFLAKASACTQFDIPADLAEVSGKRVAEEEASSPKWAARSAR